MENTVSSSKMLLMLPSFLSLKCSSGLESLSFLSFSFHLSFQAMVFIDCLKLEKYFLTLTKTKFPSQSSPSKVVKASEYLIPGLK